MTRIYIIAYCLLVSGAALSGLTPRISSSGFAQTFAAQAFAFVLFLILYYRLTSGIRSGIEKHMRPDMENYRASFGNPEKMKELSSENESKILTTLLTADGISDVIIDMGTEAIKNIFKDHNKNKEQIDLEQKIIAYYTEIIRTRAQFRMGLYIAGAFSAGVILITI